MVFSMPFFCQKVIVITGSTQGIGYSLAELLCELGARVVINSRSETSVQKAVKKTPE
jgi:NAD(P)-dependent dehydrogenase (short-subunit alcohol dehydrogenase family)